MIMSKKDGCYEKDRKYTIEDLEAVLDMLPYQIWLKDSEGRHIYVNKLCAEKVGLSKEEMIGTNDYEIRDYETAEQCVKTDKILTNKDSHVYIEEHVNIDNQDIFFRVNKFKLIKDNDQKDIIGGIAEEISLEKTIQMELEDNLLNTLNENKTEKDSRGFLESVMKSLKDNIKCKDIEAFLYDKDEKKFSLYFSLNKDNNVFEDKQDIYIDEEIEEKLYSNDFIQNKYSELRERIMSVQKNNSNDTLKLKHVKLANELFGLVCIYFDHDNAIAVDDVFLDEVFTKISIILKQIENKAEILSIKEKKEELEDIVKLDRVKSDFFANVSHEFRTPVNVILSSIQLMLSDTEVNKIIHKHRKYLKLIKENAYRLLRLVNNNIDASQISNNCFDVNMKNQNIISIVEDITMCAVKNVQEKNRNIIFDTDEEELIVACDSELIEKIMLNLVSNAVKFSKDNSDIYVDVLTDFQQNKVFVSVKNVGDKIDKDCMNGIFRKSTQLDSLYTRKNEGSGLGLFLTKKYAEMHGGNIYMDNSDEYTKFVFYLPIYVEEDKEVYERQIDENKMIEKCNVEFSDIY